MPPYLRLVPPVGLLEGSKMICCLSGGMPMPVSLTEKAITVPARFERLVVGAPAALGRLACCRRDLALLA